MKQTAVEWLEIELKKKGFDFPYVTLKIEQAKELEKQQIIESGNSCAFKQHLHSERINKMSMDELGEEYYNETFKNK